MDSKPSNEYVSEILKQIEELKRRKAQKEMKLKKLKSSKSKKCDQKLKPPEISSNVIFKKPYDLEILKDNVLHERNSCQIIQPKKARNCVNCNNENDAMCTCYENCGLNSSQETNYVPNFENRSSNVLYSHVNKANEKESIELMAATVDKTGKSVTENCQTEIANVSDTTEMSNHNEKINDVDIHIDTQDCLNKNMSYFFDSEESQSSDKKCIDIYSKSDNCENINDNNPNIQQSKGEMCISPEFKVIALSSSSRLNDSQESSFSFINFPKFSSPSVVLSKDNVLEDKSLDSTVLNDTSVDKFNSKAISNFFDQGSSIQVLNNIASEFSNELNDTPHTNIHHKTKDFSDSFKKHVCEEEKIEICSVVQETEFQDLAPVISNYEESDKLELSINNSINIQLNHKEEFENKLTSKNLFLPIKKRPRDDSESDSIDLNLQSEFSDSLDFSLSGNMVAQFDVTETVNVLLDKVCINIKNDSLGRTCDFDIKVVPETEDLGDYLYKDEDFLETSTLSEGLNNLETNADELNTSSQSNIASPVVNKIVSAVRLSKDICSTDNECLKPSTNSISHFKRSLDIDSLHNVSPNVSVEEDTQDLGCFKSIPLLNENEPSTSTGVQKCKDSSDSNLKFLCCLKGIANEPVCNVEIASFNNSKYLFIQHTTQIHVWRQVENKNWIKIFYHAIDEKFLLKEICISKDDNFLVLIMLLSENQNHCFQFLLFEKEVNLIKLMENAHWLEEKDSIDSFILCDLEGLMFASAICKEVQEVHLYAFINLRDNPKLTSVILEVPDDRLKSLCKIEKLPNALMGVCDSSLYIWHILEARLVAAVALHPQDYFPFKNCFWATVENGLIYFMTTCDNDQNLQVCQLLAANLATGLCQVVMTYSIQPAQSKRIKVLKAAFSEPFLAVAHSGGAFLWSVTEEYCFASLENQLSMTSIALCTNTESQGFVGVGSSHGCVNCYILK